MRLRIVSLLLTALVAGSPSMALPPPPAGWSPPPGLQAEPVLAGSPDTLFAAWTDDRDGSGRVWWTRWPADAADTAAAPAETAPFTGRTPALARDGWTLLVWSTGDPALQGGGIRGRELPDGGPVAPGATADLAGGAASFLRPAVAVRGDTALVAWEDGRDGPGRLRVGRWARGSGPLDPQGTPVPGAGDRFRPRLAPAPWGFLLAWERAGGPVELLRLGPDGAPLGDPVAPGGPVGFEPDVAAGDGRFLLVWREGSLLAALHLDGDGHPCGGVFALPDGDGLCFGPRVTAAGGRFVLAWSRQDAAGRALRCGRVDATDGWDEGPHELAAPTTYAADKAACGLGAGAALAWREPGPEDDDDLALAWLGATGGPGPVGHLTLVRREPLHAEPETTPLLAVSANPFRGAVTVRASGPVRVYDAAGRRVRDLPGTGARRWDGADGEGRPLPAGVYFVSGESGPAVRVVKLP